MPLYLWPLLILIFTQGLDQTNTLFLTPYFLSLGFEGSLIGLLMGLFRISSLLFIVPAGLLSDRIPIRRLVLVGLSCLLVFYLVFQATASPLLLGLMMIVGGAGTAVVFASMNALFYKLLGERKTHGVATYNVSRSIVQGLFNMGGGAILLVATFSLFFRVGAWLVVPLLLMVFLLPKNETYQVTVGDYFKELREKRVVWLYIFYSIFIFHVGADWVTVPTRWREIMHFTSLQMGILQGIPIMVIGVTVSIFSAMKLGKTARSRRRMALLGLLLSGLGHFGIALAPTFTLTLLARFVHIGGDSLMEMFYLSEFANIFAKQRVGGHSSFFFILQNVVGFASITLAGVWGSYAQGSSFLFVTGSVMILGAVLSREVLRRAEGVAED